jgi:hypothetical protein
MIRAYIFLAGLAVICVGIFGASVLDDKSSMGFMVGALTLGGGFLICGFFTLKMFWHGVVGAGVLALLGFGRGVLNLPDAAKHLIGERSRGQAPLLELAVTVICAFVLTRIIAAWNRERTRRLLKE